MSFQRPLLSELIARVEADFVSRLQITTVVLRRAFVRIAARVWAGVAHLLHGHIQWAVKQLFASTAEKEFLVLHGSELGIEPKPATYATGNATFTGTNDVGIPSDTRLLRADGTEYRTTASAVIASGTATIAISATQFGSAGNADEGVELTIANTIAGVNALAVVASGGIANGVDSELDTQEDLYRARILARKQNPPQGGSINDYIRWALEVPGVTRAFPRGNYPSAGIVTVMFVLDGEVDIIPDGAKVAEMQAYLDDPSRRIICATPEALAPTDAPLNLTLHIVPDTIDVRAAVVAELEDYLFRKGDPGATLLLADINDAISSAAGETSHTLTVPSGNVTHTAVEIPTLGTITWT